MKILENKLDLSTGVVMGILNITKDSFYDGGKHNSISKIIRHVHKMLNDGASIIDIGAQSSRPGSEEIPENVEWKKINNVIKTLKNEFPNIIISVDTYRSSVAEKSINIGADIINDISAGNLDQNMFSIIAKYKVPYIMMHMKGNPKNMQDNPSYINVVKEINYFFEERIKKLRKIGVKDIILDPGFGFGKKIEHNYQILNRLNEFKKHKLPILAGVSRKSMIYNLIESSASKSLNGTTVVNVLSLLKGASILRVHDVKEAVECLKIINFVKKT
tara:strand:+ start:9280 stop:10101 length:822 start_codon:yes stop_codon:yes gene_type:complete